MQNFDLNIETEGTSYLIRARIEGAEATHPFEFPFTDMELENLLLRMGTGQHGVWRRSGDAPELQAAKEFGERLFESLFTGSVRDLLRNAQNDYPSLRLRLAFTHAPDLANLPWEFLYDREENMFLALSGSSPIVRYLEHPRRVEPLTVAPPLRLLVIIAAPVDLETLDADTEWNNLQAALSPLVERGILQIDRLTPPTFAALQIALRRTPYHLLHFVGHGAFEESVQDGVLFLEDERRHSRRTNGQSLGFLLRDYRATLRFVFLNVCEGGKTAVNDPFAGVAQSLIQQGIPAVLAMQSAVRDDYALTVARTFYATLTDNVSLESALTDARLALFAETQRVEWGIPVLYTRTQEGTLFAIESERVTPLVRQSVAEAQSLPEKGFLVEKVDSADRTLQNHTPSVASTLQETVGRIPQKFRAPDGNKRWGVAGGILIVALLFCLASGGLGQVQALLASITTPSDISDNGNAPSDYPFLTSALLQAAEGQHSLEEVSSALAEQGYLNNGSVWEYDKDLTSDGRGDWILQTSHDTAGCNTLILVEPNAPELLHDSYAYVGNDAAYTLKSIDDVTGDGYNDVLFQMEPCTGTTFSGSAYQLWSLQGNIQSSQEVAYLKLLQANELFDRQAYQEAQILYNELFSVTPGNQTGWKYEQNEELNAIQKFAGARLIIISLIEKGNDDGHLAEFQSRIDINDPYQMPLKTMVENGAGGTLMTGACTAFRDAVDDPSGLTYPLNAMGSIVLTTDDICPF